MHPERGCFVRASGLAGKQQRLPAGCRPQQRTASAAEGHGAPTPAHGVMHALPGM